MVRRTSRTGDLEGAWKQAVIDRNFNELLELLLCGSLNGAEQKVRALGKLDDPSSKVEAFQRGFLHAAVASRFAGQEHFREWGTVEQLFVDRMRENQPALVSRAKSSRALKSLFWLAPATLLWWKCRRADSASSHMLNLGPFLGGGGCRRHQGAAGTRPTASSTVWNAVGSRCSSVPV